MIVEQFSALATSTAPSFASLSPLYPEITLALGSLGLLLLGLFRGDKAYREVSFLACLLFLLTAGLIVSSFNDARLLAFDGLFIADNFSNFMKLLVLVGSFGALAMSRRYLEDRKIARFEYAVLIGLSTVGMFLMISAGSLLTLYVGLELQSLALYILAAIDRDRGRASEAGLKYFVLGALSSGMLLYGISLIYGFTGSVSFDVLAESLRVGEAHSIGLVVGLMFLIAGLAFKVSAAPFHMWAPDVYEGAPTPITAFFAAAPKIAAVGLLVRVLFGAFPGLVQEWQQVIIFMSVASMLVGAFLALVQSNIKRLMAYSSIGHVGFALVGLAAGTQAGVEALVIYMAIYLTMTLGSFGVILSMRRGDIMLEDIKNLSGLARMNLPLAVAMAIFMFSLAGIPLLAGFFGKWFVFLAAVEAGLWPLAVIGVVTSVVSAYYYLRIVKIMFFDEAEAAFDGANGRSISWLTGLAALANSPLSYFLLIAPLTVAARWAVQALFF